MPRRRRVVFRQESFEKNDIGFQRRLVPGGTVPSTDCEHIIDGVQRRGGQTGRQHEPKPSAPAESNQIRKLHGKSPRSNTAKFIVTSHDNGAPVLQEASSLKPLAQEHST